MPARILLATPTLGNVRVEWATGLRIQTQPTGLNWDLVNIIGQTVDNARNVAVQTAKDNGYEFLLFYDDDVVPYDDMAVAHLINGIVQHPEISVLGGVYPRRNNNCEPIVIKERGGGVWWGWEDHLIHKVWMTGTGFTIYRMADLPTVGQYAAPDGTLIGQYFHSSDGQTDDAYFAQLCEQHDLGWYVHGKATARQMDLDGRVYDVKHAKELMAV